MSVDLRKVKKLIELVESSDITELEVRDGEETIRIARHPAPPPSTAAAPVVAASVQAPSSENAHHEPHFPMSGFELRAPMAGVFYRAPEPEAEPFVEVGTAVSAGEVLCIIESMKMMNEIKAERAGVVTAVEVENGAPVSAGQVLFRFE